MSPSYRNPKCRHSRERHTADLEFCRHRLLIVTVMVRRQDNDQMRDVHVSVSTIHDGIRFVPCHHETADEQDTITGAGPIVERFDDDHVDQTLQWRLCLRASENERVWDVTSGGSIGMTPARHKGQVPSLPLIELNQQLSVSSSEMSTTFHTALLPARLIQSVLLPPPFTHGCPPVLRSFLPNFSEGDTDEVYRRQVFHDAWSIRKPVPTRKPNLREE